MSNSPGCWTSQQRPWLKGVSVSNSCSNSWVSQCSCLLLQISADMAQPSLNCGNVVTIVIEAIPHTTWVHIHRLSHNWLFVRSNIYAEQDNHVPFMLATLCLFLQLCACLHSACLYVLHAIPSPQQRVHAGSDVPLMSSSLAKQLPQQLLQQLPAWLLQLLTTEEWQSLMCLAIFPAAFSLKDAAHVLPSTSTASLQS